MSAYPSLSETGAWHNTGCDTILASVDTNNIPQTPTDRWTTYQKHGNRGISLVYGADTSYHITGESDTFAAYISITERTNNIGYVFSDSRAKASTYSVWSSAVSSQDAAILDSIGAFFNAYSASGKTYAQIAQDFSAKASSLITYYNSLTWPDNTGEVSGGALYVMQSSTNLWKEWLDSNPSKQNLGPQAIYQVVQADAAGYLIGWTVAVIDEWSSSGTLNINNQGKRMGKGVDGAIYASTGGWFGKIWGKK
ncbi:MAG: hypothetical protein HYX66_03580 [Ignavibacteria bacterium]|nr:hypothetical protein [Ignavibacteria bacterium]